ncbi:MAG: flagellin lysine-N-methylase [Ruminococcus sp.]|nr:flagellin lysine-N-methylase [Ruminococcus sp.]
MQEIYPRFYHEFKCIANRCEDSCCKDWDIDLDSATEAFYRTVKGPLGDKMRRLAVTDEDGDRVFRSVGGRCPFWNDDMLCDIFIGVGEEHLSETCANFPRVAVDYGGFREHLLSFACPEAARFMLRSDSGAYADFGGAVEYSVSEDRDDGMSFLLKARARTARLLTDRTVSLAYRLADCLEFNAQVQCVLDGFEPAPLPEAEGSGGCGFILEMHQGFEIMSDAWRDALKQTAARADSLRIRDDFDDAFEQFALYYLYRYYLEAVNSGDVMYAMRRMTCAYLVTGKMDALFFEQGYPYERMRILQRYSKEVEHSYENTDALNACFEQDERFSPEKLIQCVIHNASFLNP